MPPTREDLERWADLPFATGEFVKITRVDAKHLARVALAAMERVKHGHSETCGVSIHGPDAACTCGHDALAAALKGEEKQK